MTYRLWISFFYFSLALAMIRWCFFLCIFFFLISIVSLMKRRMRVSCLSQWLDNFLFLSRSKHDRLWKKVYLILHEIIVPYPVLTFSSLFHLLASLNAAKIPSRIFLIFHLFLFLLDIASRSENSEILYLWARIVLLLFSPVISCT